MCIESYDRTLQHCNALQYPHSWGLGKCLSRMCRQRGKNTRPFVEEIPSQCTRLLSELGFPKTMTGRGY